MPSPNVIIFFFNANEVSFGSNNDLDTCNQAVLAAFFVWKYQFFHRRGRIFCVQKGNFPWGIRLVSFSSLRILDLGNFETLRGHTFTEEVTFVDVSLYTVGQNSAYRQTSVNNFEKYEFQKDFVHVQWKCTFDLRMENVNSQEVTWKVILLDLETRWVPEVFVNLLFFGLSLCSSQFLKRIWHPWCYRSPKRTEYSSVFHENCL